MKKRNRLLFLLLTVSAMKLCMYNCRAQSQVYGNNSFQSFASAGTTNGAASDGANIRLYSIVGQPIANNASAAGQSTQSGFLSSVTSGVVVSDKVPPTISVANQQATVLTNGTTSTFSASITDNVGVISPKIFYKKIMAKASTFAEAPLVAGSTANTYTVGILDSWHDEIGLEYYYTATDKAGNPTRLPSTGSYFTYLTVPSVQVPAAAYSFGNDVSKYRIIAMPYTSDAGEEISSVFGTSSGLPKYAATKSSWRLATYENGAIKEYPDLPSFYRGKGYWFILKDQATIILGSKTAPANNRNSLYVIELKSGWNMIGNPYPVALKWSEVQGFAFADNKNLGDLHTWDNIGVAGGYRPVSDWAAFQGGFVKNTTGSDIKITIPFPGQTATGGRQSSVELSSDISSSNWQISLDIFQANGFNKLARFGMIDTKQLGEELKSYNPPSFENSPEINFNVGKLCRSIVTTQPKHTWKFEASGIVGQTTELTWSPILGSGQEGIFLLDENSLQLINMKEVSSYQFVMENNHTFSILFAAKAEQATPDNIVLARPYPNPIQDGKATFTFGLPEAVNPYQAEIQIYGGNGILINTHEQTLQPGIQSLVWEPTDEIKSGLYYYRIKVASGDNFTTQRGKIIMP